MANEEHLKILKQGVEAWNRWRVENPEIKPDLRGADFSSAYLSDDHRPRKDRIGDHLSGADFLRADFRRSDLREAMFITANLREADLSEANLSETDLTRANLTDAYLSRANLSHAVLGDTDFSSADLQDANLAEANMGWSRFNNNNLSATRGLETVKHLKPSDISISTFSKSKGNIPETFLRGCGMSDWEIENAKLFNPDLSNEEITNIQYRIHDLRVRQALQISPLFISYNHHDCEFVNTLEKHLTVQGVRYWRDIHHATAGRLEKQVDRAISLNDTVLIILSENSVNSDWVEYEVDKAREKERKSGKDTLCPVALDDSWKDCRWSGPLRKQIEKYHILDFSNWQDDAQFQKMFGKLLEGLNLFYK